MRSWYVVYTSVNVEMRVARDLRAQRFETFVPCETSIKTRRAKRVTMRRPLFSRYVFAAFDAERDEWYAPIAAVNGVQGILRSRATEAPVPVPVSLIQELQRREANGAFDKDKLPARGEEFRVVTGPFEGWIGKITSARASGRVKILLKLLDRIVPAEYSLENLERITPTAA